MGDELTPVSGPLSDEPGVEVRRPVGRPKRDGTSVAKPRKKKKYIPRKARHGLSIPDEKLQEMFTTYCQMPNYSYVARVCNVHMQTVKRYALQHNWAERRDKIMEEARKRVDYDITAATEESLSLIKQLKNKVQEKIETLETKDMNPAFLVSDLERLVKMEQVLLGGVGDRSEKVVTSHEERIKALREKRVIDISPKQLSEPSR